MKFKIVEEINTDKKLTDKELNFIIETIKRDCKYFLKESKSQQFFTGVTYDNKSNNVFFKKMVRHNRNPRDMSLELTNSLDNYFDKEYNLGGWKPRTQSKFFTSNKSTARGYGRTYNVFPIGNFKYLWSPDIEDLYTVFDAIGNESDIMQYLSDLLYVVSKYKTYDVKILDDIIDEVIGEEDKVFHDDYVSLFDDILYSLENYKTTDLDEADGEVMFGPAGTEYYLLSPEIITDDFLELLYT